MRIWQLLAAFLSGQVSAATQAVPSMPAILSISDRATGVEQHGNTLSLALFNGHASLDVAIDDQEAEFPLLKVIAAATNARRQNIFKFDAFSGRISPTDGLMHYRLCGVIFDELAAAPKPPCEIAKQPPKLGTAPWLSVAVAHAEYGDPALGLSMLNEAMPSIGQSQAALIVALKARIVSIDALTEDIQASSSEGDRLTLVKLADARRLRQLIPDDAGHALVEAESLSLLGDFESAKGVYDAVARKWPDNSATIAMHLSFVERQRGDYARSLEYLSKYAGRSESLGMPFYYHRGWTLFEMKRFDEAIAAFSDGMKFQQDYAWAFMRRGCAYAAIGETSKAIDDLDQASVLFGRQPAIRTESFTNLKAAIAAERAKITRAKPSSGSAVENESCGFLNTLAGSSRTKSAALKD